MSTPPWVVKIGGRELDPTGALARVAERLAEAVRKGIPTVAVHGGGEEVSARADALGLPTERVDGQRVTDEAMREVVVEVLAGRVNLRVVGALQGAGCPAVGLTGVSGGILTVRPFGEPPGKLGFVGRPTRVDPKVLRPLLDSGMVPVVAPLGVDAAGTVYNVNADLAAGAIAGALGADLALLTDVPGVLDSSGEVLATVRTSRIPSLLASGAIRGGMIPKLTAAAEAISAGARSAWIGDLAELPLPPGLPRGGTRVIARRGESLPLLPGKIPGGRTE